MCEQVCPFPQQSENGKTCLFSAPCLEVKQVGGGLGLPFPPRPHGDKPAIFKCGSLPASSDAYAAAAASQAYAYARIHAPPERHLGLNLVSSPNTFIGFQFETIATSLNMSALEVLLISYQ